MITHNPSTASTKIRRVHRPVNQLPTIPTASGFSKPDITLQPDELKKITGYEQATKQLNVLRRRGFNRAYISRRGLVLERAHYDAVCQGQVDKPAAKEANLSFMGARK